MGNTVSTNASMFETELYSKDPTAISALDVPPLPSQKLPYRPQTYRERQQESRPSLVVERAPCRPRAVTQPVCKTQPKTAEPAPAQQIANNWRRSIDPYVKRTFSCPQGSPTIDFDSIPVLQPDGESDSDPASPASLDNLKRYEHQALQVKIVDTSPRFSHYGSVHHSDDFDFLPASPASSPQSPLESYSSSDSSVSVPDIPGSGFAKPVETIVVQRPRLIRRATSPTPAVISRTPSSVYSSMSMRSDDSVKSTKSEPVRRDSLDTGVPPPVPPHAILNGRRAYRPVSMPGRPRSKSDASQLPFDIYTRKCRLTSPETSEIISSRLAPRSVSVSPVISEPKESKESKEPYRFALDGYNEKAPLRVVNKDPEIPKKFYVKSKAMLAFEQERLQEEFYARQALA